jgi:hypothetical protein
MAEIGLEPRRDPELGPFTENFCGAIDANRSHGRTEIIAEFTPQMAELCKEGPFASQLD